MKIKIETMFQTQIKIRKLFYFFILIILSTDAKEICELDNLNKRVIFSSLLDFQTTHHSFDPEDSTYQGNVVDFSFKSIDRLPRNSFISFGSSKIVKMSLNNKNIKTVNSGAFNSLFCLTYLELRGNNISGTSKYTFNGLDNLRQLDLSGNAFQRVSKNGCAFHSLDNLKVLNLSRNVIVTVNSFDFFNLTNLEVLDLGYNKISIVPSDLFILLHCLKQLYLNNNNLNVIEPELWKGLNNLYLLNLAVNFLNKFDSSHNFSFVNLKKLDVSQNLLSYLNVVELKKHLPKLATIDIRTNHWFCDDLDSINRQLIDFNILVIGIVNCSRFRNQYRADTSAQSNISRNTVRTTTNITDDKNLRHNSKEVFVENGRILFTSNEVLENVHQLQTLLGYICAIIVVFVLADISVRIGLWQNLYNRLNRSHIDDRNETEHSVLLRR